MIYLLRHGQTEYNAERRIQGQCDSALTALGREQARSLGQLLRDHVGDGDGFEFVSSPLGRTMATSQIVREAAGLSAPITPDPRLMEIGCGSWENRLHSFCRGEIDAPEGMPFIDFWRHYCPDGEGYEAALGRAQDWLNWAEGRRVIAVAHGIIGIFLRGTYLGLSQETMARMPTPQDRLFRLHDGKAEELLPAGAAQGGSAAPTVA